MKTLNKLFALIVFVVFAALSPTLVWAQNPCDGLSADAAAEVKAALSTSYAYDCCDSDLATCLKANPPCALVKRLEAQACRHAAKGKTAAEIKRVLENRALTMAPEAKKHEIARRLEMLWGKADAEVVLTVYLCNRCQFCSRRVPKLIESLSAVGLDKKIAVNLRLFPIKSHAGATAAAIANEAAAKQGKAWAFLLESYKDFDSFDDSSPSTWAQNIGLDQAEFEAQIAAPATRAAVVASKKEGLVNGVEATPILYLDGRRLRGSFENEDIIDMIEEALEMRKTVAD